MTQEEFERFQALVDRAHDLAARPLEETLPEWRDMETTLKTLIPQMTAADRDRIQVDLLDLIRTLSQMIEKRG